MENKRGNEIFLGVVGVTTLLVAIIGATFAYFSASATSGNEAVSIQSTELSLGYDDTTDELSTDLIPTADNLALYAGTNKDWIEKKTISYQTPKLDAQGQPIEGQFDTITTTGKGLCKDDNGNEICGIYTFRIGNPNFTTAMNIEGSVTSTKNEFTNIWFAVYDETNTQVVKPTKFPATSESVKLTGLEQQLVGSSKDVDTDGNPITGFDPEKPSTYTPVVDKTKPENAAVPSNVRTYRMVIWVHEIDDDQTKADSGKILTAALKFETEGGAGVTGVIAAADAQKPAA